MPDPNEAKDEKSLLDGGDVTQGKKEEQQQTPEQLAAAKTAQEAEEKRLLDTKDEELKEEDKPKKAAVVKAKEEKRLMETPDDKLSEADKEAKAALVKAKEDAAKAKAEADKKGAPEKYTDFKVPQGLEVVPLVLDEFKAIAKELNLTQDGAQKLVDLQVKHTQAIQDGMVSAFVKVKEDWKQETVKALGANFKTEVAFAGKALERFGTPELRKLLNETATGNNIEMVNMLIKIGKAISEDKLVTGDSKAGAKETKDLFYPGMTK